MRLKALHFRQIKSQRNTKIEVHKSELYLLISHVDFRMISSTIGLLVSNPLLQPKLLHTVAYPLRHPITFGCHRWIFLFLRFESWGAGTPLLLRNFIHDARHVLATSEPGRFLWSGTIIINIVTNDVKSPGEEVCAHHFLC